MGLTVAKSAFTVSLRERDKDGAEVEILRKSSFFVYNGNGIRLSGCGNNIEKERIGTLWRL